jgi:DNA-binding NarL/FixJ family response regulator
MSATVIAPTAFTHGRTRTPRLTLLRGGADCAQGSAVGQEIRVVLVHPEALVRAALRFMLQAEAGITVAGEAATADEAVVLARRTRPDVVLLDTALPGLDTVAATRQIAMLPEARVMLLGASERDSSVFSILRAGASGFLVKDSEPAELVRAVRALASGDAALSPAIARRLIARLVAQE